MAEYTTPGRNTVDEMVLRDAVLTDGLIPLETMNQVWGQGNVFLAYKQSHSLMEYIAQHYGPEKISRIPPPVGQPARHRQAHGSPESAWT